MGLVHRDLSMPDILVEAGTARVADLGMVACASNLVLEETMATLALRAPEVLLGFTQLVCPPAMDIWSCGVVLTALFIGQLPFGDGRASEPQVFHKQARFCLN